MLRTLFVLFVFTLTNLAYANVEVEPVKRALLEQEWSFVDRETPVQREARAEVMARSLRDAARDLAPGVSQKVLVAATMSVWWHESRFSLQVHRGEPTRWGSDDGRAKCFGQLHERSVGLKLEEGEALADFRMRQRELWASLAGTDYESTKRCARATMRLLLHRLSACRSEENPWLGAFGAYGRGDATCLPLPSSEHRHRLMLRIISRL